MSDGAMKTYSVGFRIMLVLSMVLIPAMKSSACAGLFLRALRRVGGPRTRQAVDEAIELGLIENRGGVQDLVAYLHRHREKEWVQASGCMVLMTMCLCNTENRRIAGEQGAIQAVVDALNRHRGNKEVQKQGLMALASMSRDNTENKRIAREQGAIQAVVNALNCHRGNKEVRATGHRALVIMCQDNTENMVRSKGPGTMESFLFAWVPP